MNKPDQLAIDQSILHKGTRCLYLKLAVQPGIQTDFSVDEYGRDYSK
ncbi:hypothetical protein [Gynuella sp.]